MNTTFYMPLPLGILNASKFVMHKTLSPLRFSLACLRWSRIRTFVTLVSLQTSISTTDRDFKSRCVSTNLVLIYIIGLCKFYNFLLAPLFRHFWFSFIAKNMNPQFFVYILSLQWRFHLSSRDYWVGKILGNYYCDCLFLRRNFIAIL